MSQVTLRRNWSLRGSASSSTAMPAMQITRRGFLGGAFGTAGMLLPGFATVSQAAVRDTGEQLTVTPLGENLTLLSTNQWNALTLSGADGALLVDGGSAAYSRTVLETASRLARGGVVTTLFNTHWHWDHTGANESAGARHAQIIAHRNTRLWLGVPVTVEWQQRTYPPRPAAALPTRTFVYGTPDLTFADQPVRYGHLPASHTDGDIYVHFPRHNLIAAGGVVSSGRYPIIDYSTGGWIGGMADAVRLLIGLCNDGTRIIPESGGILSLADLQVQLQLYETVRDRIREAVRKALDFEDLLATRPTREFDGRFGDPEPFLRLAWNSTHGHDRDSGWIY